MKDRRLNPLKSFPNCAGCGNETGDALRGSGDGAGQCENQQQDGGSVLLLVVHLMGKGGSALNWTVVVMA